MANITERISLWLLGSVTGIPGMGSSYVIIIGILALPT